MRSAYYKKFPIESIQKIEKGAHKGKYYIRYKGITIFRTTYDGLIDKIIEIDNGKTKNVSLDDISGDFFQFRRLKCASSTYAKDLYNYRTYIKGTNIATKRIENITFDDGIAWADSVISSKDECRKKYFDNVIGTLTQMLKYCVGQKRIISSNPLTDLSIHRDHFSTKTITAKTNRYYNDEELAVASSMAYEKAHNEHKGLYLVLPLFANIGVRIGEMCALHWGDITGSYMHVWSEWVEDQDDFGKRVGWKWVDHSKTEAGDRYVPLNSEAQHILKTVKRYNFENGYPVSHDDFIFYRTYHGVDSVATPRAIDNAIRNICDAVEMPQKSAHDLRRTFATNASYAGIPTKTIQGWMGHESIAQTEAYICIKKDDSRDLDDIEKLSLWGKDKQKNKQIL